MNTPTNTDSLFDLIANGMLRDQFRFRRRFAKLNHQKNQNDHAQQLARLERDIRASALLRTERLAARSIANQIAEELQTEVGAAVGYKVRFKDQVGPKSYLKLMTDGIL